jgi:hypothetical protein
VGTSTRSVLRLADGLLAERLRDVGFLRVERGIYERVGVSAGVHGWLGLNESVAGGVRLWPFVGVRHRAVEAMLDQLGASAYSGPLTTVQLGYLMPEATARCWTFQGEADPDERAAGDLATTVQRFALPFIESNRDLPALAESIKTNADEDSRAYVLPVIYRLLGQPQLAEQALDPELRADQSEAGDSYRRFVEHLMRT